MNVQLLQVYVISYVCIPQSVVPVLVKFDVVSLCFISGSWYHSPFVQFQVPEQSCLQLFVGISYVYHTIHLNAHCS
ncbi:hypothetical protein FACS189475_04300 [Betaproteobacteria bacterium]|nr:hypothetical protein FACS189475_04300 [Betaproteobacteria bacterium]